VRFSKFECCDNSLLPTGARSWHLQDGGPGRVHQQESGVLHAHPTSGTHEHDEHARARGSQFRTGQVLTHGQRETFTQTTGHSWCNASGSCYESSLEQVVHGKNNKRQQQQKNPFKCRINTTT